MQARVGQTDRKWLVAFKRVIKGGAKQVGGSHLSLERVIFCSFKVWLRGLHDLLRERPSSLFMLSGWSTISVAQVDCWFPSTHLG
jgi:hypothetical protein